MRFDQQQIRAAVDQAARLILEGVAHLVEGDRAERRVVDVRRDRQRLGWSGRASRRRSAACPACFAVHSSATRARQLARLRGSARRRSPRGRSRPATTDVALNVLVSMMSAPASRYSAWMLGDHVGPRQHQHVVVALEILRVRLEALAAEIGFGQLVALDHGAHRAVEDEDAFGEQAFECRGRRAVVVSGARCFVCVIGYFLLFVGFVPIASSTANGSLVRRAPSATRTSSKPARVSMPDRCSSLNPNQLIAELLAHPGLVVRAQVEDQQPAARLAGRARLRRARRPDRRRDAAPATAARRRSTPVVDRQLLRARPSST